MVDDCIDCGIGIEPKVAEDKADTTAPVVDTTTELPTTKIEEPLPAGVPPEVPIDVALEEPTVEIPEDAEVSGMLGLLTAGCLLTDEAKREECWKGIEPLETTVRNSKANNRDRRCGKFREDTGCTTWPCRRSKESDRG
jgi:hypothetical protein